MEPEIAILSKERLPEALDFYASQNYSAGAREEDVVIAALDKNKIIGVVRLCREEGVNVLRGMFIDKPYQRKGIGSSMLEKAASLMENKEYYCIPYSHLEDFYGQIGFREIATSAAPAHLQERLARYLGMGNRMMIMKRAQ